MHDGAHLMLKKLDPTQHDPTSRMAALHLLEEARIENHFITGLIYVDKQRESMHESSHLVETPLAYLSNDVLRPDSASLDKIMDRLICCD